MKNKYYVVDLDDQFVLYAGTLEDCISVQETSYAGVAVVSFNQLTPKMKSSMTSLRKKEG